jgi:hypothetical protein
MLKDLDKKMKNLDTLDIVLIKWAAVVAGIIIIKIFPQFLNISWLLLIVVLVVLAARPLYDFLNYEKKAK